MVLTPFPVLLAQEQASTQPSVADLTAAVKALQETVARQNEILSRMAPPPVAHPKLVKTMKIVNTLGAFATVALPLVVKANQAQVNTVTVVPKHR